MRWRILFAVPAQSHLQSIKDGRIRAQISKRIDALEDDPDRQGKPLNEDLSGYRSVRAVGQRYRIIYKLEETQNLVLVAVIGIRKKGDKKDVYAVANKLARLGLLDLVAPLISPPAAEDDDEAEVDDKPDGPAVREERASYHSNLSIKKARL